MNSLPPLAALAGVVAGTFATVIELLLWWLGHVPLPDTLFRDARLTAAIVLGASVLEPAATFEWRVMFVASVVHFALSIVYGLVLAVAVAPLRIRPSIVAGALYGLLLYAINMYGFTLVFPWFTATRDAITVAAHVVFGATAAGVYKYARRDAAGGATG